MHAMPGSNVKTTLSRFSIVKIFYHQYYDKLMKRCKGKVLSGDSGSMPAWYFLWFLLKIAQFTFECPKTECLLRANLPLSLPSELDLDQYNNIIITILLCIVIIVILRGNTFPWKPGVITLLFSLLGMVVSAKSFNAIGLFIVHHEQGIPG